MCKLASRVFFTVTTRKLPLKQVISINWKRLTAFFVIMVIFNCLTEYGLRTKKFLNLFAKPFKKYQQQPEHSISLLTKGRSNLNFHFLVFAPGLHFS